MATGPDHAMQDLHRRQSRRARAGSGTGLPSAVAEADEDAIDADAGARQPIGEVDREGVLA